MAATTFLPIPPILMVFSALTIVIFCLAQRRSSNSKQPLPPGPRGLPLIGNILDVPRGHEWVTFRSLSRKYDSDIIHLNMAGTPTIVVNSLKIAQDLFDKRSSIYSDRDLMGFWWNFGIMGYGDYCGKFVSLEHRKLFHQEFETSAVQLHRPRQLKASRSMLLQLLEKPFGFVDHFRHMTGMIILSTAYGIDIQLENDPFVTISEKSIMAMSEAGSFGAFLVDSFPVLKYVPDFLPGAGFKRQAKLWRKTVSAMRELPFQFVKDSLAAGTAQSSIASRVLETIDDDINAPHREGILKNVLATIYLGGADTSVSSMSTFMLAMVHNPSLQKKAQAAVDEVVGHDRLPEFSDRDSIPYIDAIVKEVLRWHPVLPLGVAHAASTADTYLGYHIPAGAVVIGNSWAILNDKAIYGTDTEIFNPERWLKDGKLNPAVPDPDFAFGFGRRICPGRDMAQSSIWIAAASILATFDIEKVVNKDGLLVEPSAEYTSGMLSFPVPFQCTIRPRTLNAEILIRASA